MELEHTCSFYAYRCQVLLSLVICVVPDYPALSLPLVVAAGCLSNPWCMRRVFVHSFTCLLESLPFTFFPISNVISQGQKAHLTLQSELST